MRHQAALGGYLVREHGSSHCPQLSPQRISSQLARLTGAQEILRIYRPIPQESLHGSPLGWQLHSNPLRNACLQRLCSSPKSSLLWTVYAIAYMANLNLLEVITSASLPAALLLSPFVVLYGGIRHACGGACVCSQDNSSIIAGRAVSSSPDSFLFLIRWELSAVDRPAVVKIILA